MTDSGYSLSDIGAVAGGNGMFGGGNSAWVLIILFALIFGWGGNGFGRQGEFGQFATSASQSEILLGQQFQTLGQAINQVGDGLCSSTYALNNAIKDGNASIAGAVTNEGRAIQTQLAQYACDTQKNIDSVRFDMANYNAQTNANTNAQIQKVLDALCQNKMEAMQSKINSLELQNAVAGVVRYPNGMTYNAGTSPFCACGTNCCM